ncbi:MAG: hypothetical protein QME52_08575 [Bacteroidota bacterium]|nr:hypothetical protein [Bacteroidota bacterium]
MIFNEKQLEGYRNMSGEQRLLIAMQLSEMVRDIARSGIIHQHPEFTQDEIEKELQRRIEYGRKRIPCPYCGKV